MLKPSSIRMPTCDYMGFPGWYGGRHSITRTVANVETANIGCSFAI